MLGLDGIRIARFPKLAEAMDAAVMAGHLRALDWAGSVRAKAFVDGDVCRLQYHGNMALVLGRMFATGDEAGAYERNALAPLGRTAVVDDLGLALSVFPACGELPTLVEATDPERVARVLGATPAGIDLVRFTRTPRCVLRYRLPSGVSVYGKVAADLSPHTPRVLAGLAAAGVVAPRLVANDPGLHLMAFSELPGVRPRTGLLATGARVAAALHASAVEVPVVRR
ncbi:MAG: hypothetical protein ACRD12_12845, partial [Acidimicrobiales bacterium]